MTLVAGVDSSTQSCKVVIRDAETGALLRSGSAAHPAGTEVDPEEWWVALLLATERAGGLADVAALSVAGQQHGLVALDSAGAVIRPALLWNDLRAAESAEDLIREAGGGDRDRGARCWADAVGLVPTSSFTVAKLRWLADHEPQSVERLAAVALPHDWLTWRLRGGALSGDLPALTTDRSDASGTGYFDAVTGGYRRDLIALALRDHALAERLVLPRVAAPGEAVARVVTRVGPAPLVLGPGLGDNAGAALGLQLGLGRTMLSVGTSGVVGTVAATRAADDSGLVAGFADGTGRFLHLAVTLNAARILDATATALGVDHARLDELALAAEPGAAGLVYVPYLEGERTPNLPGATGMMHGITLGSFTPENLARATIEGLLCHLADAMDTVRAQGVGIDRVTLVGGGARSAAVRALAPGILGVPVAVPAPGEYVADGAARQAAWACSGSAEPPSWPLAGMTTFTGEPVAGLRDAYRHAAAAAASLAG